LISVLSLEHGTWSTLLLNVAITTTVFANTSAAGALLLVVDVRVVALVALGAHVRHRRVENEAALSTFEVDGLLLLHAGLHVHSGRTAALHHVALRLLLLGVAHWLLLLRVAHRLLLLRVAHLGLLLLLRVAHWLLLLGVSHLLLLLLGVALRLLLHTRLHHGLLLGVALRLLLHTRLHHGLLLLGVALRLLLLGVALRLLLHTRLHHGLLLLHHGLLLLHHGLLLLHHGSLHVVVGRDYLNSLRLMLGGLTICEDNLGWG